MTSDGTCQSRICPASSRGMSAAPKPRRARFDSGVGHSDPVSASGSPAGFEPVDGCSIRPTGTIPPRVAQWQCSRLMSGRREFDSQHADRGRSQVARRKAVNLLSWVRFPPVTPIWKPFEGSPFKVIDPATRRLRRGGSCQLGPAPRRALRSIQLAKCTRRRCGSAPAAQAARDLRVRRVPSLAATRHACACWTSRLE